jgi:hypothetical protein
MIPEGIKNAQEFQGTYNSNKYHLLFRYTVGSEIKLTYLSRKSVKANERTSLSLHVACSIEGNAGLTNAGRSNYLKVEIFDNGIKVAEQSGKGQVSLLAFTAWPTTKKEKVINEGFKLQCSGCFTTRETM